MNLMMNQRLSRSQLVVWNGSLNTIFLGLLDEDARWGKYAFHPYKEESDESDDESEVKSITIGCLLILILCW